VSPTRYRILLAVIVAVAVLRVAATLHVFCATIDEPSHIAGGYAWLTGEPYPRDLTHPPLAQILFALPLVLQGAPHPTAEIDVQRGDELLYFHREYMRNVELSRLGNLLLLAIGILGTAAWAKKLFDPTIALLAAALYSLQPSLLAHAGVATTDMAVTAILPWSMLLLDRFLDVPSLRRAVALGLVCGLGTIGKFSFIPFFAVAAVITAAIRWRAIVWRRHAIGALVAFASILFVVWAGYRFTFGTIINSHPNAPTVVARELTHVQWLGTRVPLPAPQFFTGLGALAIHNRDGHFTYFLGKYGRMGWWYYFPVILFYKTPLAFTLLFLWGVAQTLLSARRTDKRVCAPLASGVAILLSVMPSHINIGVRHVVPLYAPFAIVAAYGLVIAWEQTRGSAFGRTALAALALWLVAAGALAHPDYLAWWNEAAGAQPERIAVDSNLDWGQDWLRLLRWYNRVHPGRIGIIYAGSIDLARHPIEAYGVEPYVKTTGWIAASETALRMANTNEKDAGQPYAWLEAYQPVLHVGKGIRVYHIEE
jgi:Dolichyl-phosphate-mannose-protein mannosyltransferase